VANNNTPASLVGPAGVRVVFEGSLTEPQLDHPDGVAVHRDGSIWCGGERGQIYRLSPDGGKLEQVGSTGGFCLGMAFDSQRRPVHLRPQARRGHAC